MSKEAPALSPEEYATVERFGFDKREAGSKGFLVTEQIDGARADMPDYPLMVDDLLIRYPDGFWKVCPGVSIGGFKLTDEQISTLRPVRFICQGLDYTILPSEVAA